MLVKATEVVTGATFFLAIFTLVLTSMVSIFYSLKPTQITGIFSRLALDIISVVPDEPGNAITRLGLPKIIIRSLRTPPAIRPYRCHSGAHVTATHAVLASV